MKQLRKISCLTLAFVLTFTGCGKKQSAKRAIPEPIDDKYKTYYEIFVSSYCDSDGDGIGDLNGLISKLDYLNDNNPDTDSDLGITGIWLMPIMPSDSYHKYDVKDYYNIDSHYGTLDEFKTLLTECHNRNINVIIDLVFNHTSSAHPWFMDATTYLQNLKQGDVPNTKECKYFEYYNFEKDKESNAKYTKVPDTDWYYESQFASNMPDLNLSNQEVRTEIEEIAKYWLDLGVDGFRLDAVKEYYSGAQTKNIEVLQWFTSYVDSIQPKAYLVGECWDSFGTIAAYYESGIDSNFNYAFGDSSGKLATTVNTLGNQNAGYNLAKNMKQVQDIFLSKNPNAIEASFLSNHDNNRASSFVGYDEQKVKFLGGLNLMMNGCSFIYYGEEIGMNGVGRDENKRAPMYWSSTDSKGMTAGPEAMEPQEQKFPSVEEQTKDETSILSYYRNAIRLRNENPELLRGTIEVMEGLDHNIAAVKKTYEEKSILLLMNVSKEEKQVTISKQEYAYQELWDSLTTTEQQPVLKGEELTLPPYAIVILR